MARALPSMSDPQYDDLRFSGGDGAEPAPVRGRRCRVARAAVGLLVGAGAVCGLASLRAPGAASVDDEHVMSAASAAVQTSEDHGEKPDGQLRCGRIEQDTEYMGHHIEYINKVPSPELCCAKCQENPKCRVWVWGSWKGDKRHYQTCTLRTLPKYTQRINKVHRRGIVSGAPFNWDQPHSLFCFALARPGTYEVGLLKLQYKKQWSIFGCDEFQVVSNETWHFVPGVVTSPIVSNLHCEVGGEFRTALNNDIFITVWNRIVDDGRWEYNDWTVKVDPDTVFFPARLKVAVAFHPDTYNGLYLNNCKLGLHGPLEVLSSRAVSRWHEGIGNCHHHFNTVCSGPCRWGEDMFLSQCLEKVVHVQRIDDWNLLSEPHCESHDWHACDNRKVAFHPFKSEGAYAGCMEKADFGALPVIA